MEINASGFAAKELVPNKANIEQDLTQQAREKEDTAQRIQKPLEPRPVDQANSDKLGRIDIYA
ncbi:MAG: hypothetical protein QNJ17_06855 [Desulfocapsaceae bacterium]|nr:hypothetical protein [Desulfocapsaceae bacterium]